jgi:hypothetical protein
MALMLTPAIPFRGMLCFVFREVLQKLKDNMLIEKVLKTDSLSLVIVALGNVDHDGLNGVFGANSVVEERRMKNVL